MSDLISRKAAITAIQRYGVGSLDFSEDGWTPAEAERFVIKLLNELPSVQPERKKGRWVNKLTEDGRFSYKACSVCGFPHRAFFEFNYCTNCGAKMTEETDPCDNCSYVGEYKDPDDLFEKHCDNCPNYKEE